MIDLKRTKLGSRAMKSMFVSYAENSKADLSSNTMVESKDVEFIENKFSKDSMDVLIPTQTQEGNSNLILLWVILKGLKVVHQVKKEGVKV